MDDSTKIIAIQAVLNNFSGQQAVDRIKDILEIKDSKRKVTAKLTN